MCIHVHNFAIIFISDKLVFKKTNLFSEILKILVYKYTLLLKWKVYMIFLTLPMLRLLSSEAQGRKDFWEPSKPCLVGIHLRALAEPSQMSIHLPGFRSFFLPHFVLAKLASSSLRVKWINILFYIHSTSFDSTCQQTVLINILWLGNMISLISY